MRDSLRRRTRLAAVSVVLLVSIAGAWILPAGASLEAVFAPRKNLWPRWAAHDSTSPKAIDHSEFDRLLDRYLVLDESGVARFAYGQVTPVDRERLRHYIDALAGTPISSISRPEQLAFWINLYNALTVDVVLSHYPVRSILEIDISPGLFARGPWDKPLVRIEGQAVTLNEIEHRILRPIWNDARIHYAVNCASVSCPNLQSRAFTAAATDGMLDAAARAYVNDPRGVRIEDGRLVLSKIYEWYREDFGGSQAGVLEHLRAYAAPHLAAALAGARIGGYDYDWSLNDLR